MICWSKCPTCKKEWSIPDGSEKRLWCTICGTKYEWRKHRINKDTTK